MVAKRSARRSSRGQGLMEYALLIALVTAVVVVGLVMIAPSVSSIFQRVSPGLAPATTSTPAPINCTHPASGNCR